MIRADNPKNIKLGGVCIYYRETIPVKTIRINDLPECLVCEVNYENKKFFIVALYQSPNQNNDEFNEFLGSFENIIDNINQFNPYFALITGDFNARSSSWWGNDIDKFEGIGIEILISSYGLKQLIFEPTHLLPTDLIFTN